MRLWDQEILRDWLKRRVSLCNSVHMMRIFYLTLFVQNLDIIYDFNRLMSLEFSFDLRESLNRLVSPD